MKQVMVVRTELKMRKGKIAAQCCHGSLGAYKRSDKDKIRKWENEAYAKVVKINGELKIGVAVLPTSDVVSDVDIITQ